MPVVIEHPDTRVLVDPWFTSAFFSSWFPFPDNQHVTPLVFDTTFDFLYLSHLHQTILMLHR